MSKITIQAEVDTLVNSLSYKQKIELHKKLGVMIGKNAPLQEKSVETKYPFEKFWEAYPKYRRIDRMKCKHFWYKLSEKEREKAYEYLIRYRACTEEKYIKYVSRYLKDRKWEDVEFLEWAEKKNGTQTQERVKLKDLKDEGA